MIIPWLLLILCSASIVHAQNLAKETCSANKRMAEHNYAAANVVIDGLMALRTPGAGGFGCGEPMADAMQYFEAARFAINYLNNNNYLPGVTFGMRNYDTCLQPVADLNYFGELFPTTTSYNGYCGDTNPPKVSLGVFGPITSVESVVLAPHTGKFPVTIFPALAASTALSDSNTYPYLLRTVPTLATFARGVATLFDRLGWENTLIVYTDDAYGTNGYQQILQIAEKNDLCVSQAISVPSIPNKDDYKRILERLGPNPYAGGAFMGANAQAQIFLEAASEVLNVRGIQWILADIDVSHDFASLRQMRGGLTMLPKSRLIDEFREYFIGLEDSAASVPGNPWFREWYESVHQCSLTSVVNRCPALTQTVRRNAFVQSPYADYVILGVFAYAETIRRVCGNAGLCSTFRNLNQEQLYENIRSLDFTFPNILNLGGERIRFSDNGDREGAGFDIYSYSTGGGSTFSFRKIGSFENEQLTLTSNPVFYDSTRTTPLVTIPSSLCTGTCSNCLLPPRPVLYRYSPGDLLLVTLADGHEDDTFPLSCSEALKRKLISLAAAEWAVRKYQQTYPLRLRAVSLGSLVADVCSNPSTAHGFLSDLFGQRIQDTAGISLVSQDIIAFVNDLNDQVARAVTPVLNNHYIPELQAGATIAPIMESETTSKFIRVIPDQEMFARAISNLLVEKRWMHVQVVSNTEDRMYVDVFRVQAARYGICIVQFVDFEDGATDIVNKLLGYSLAPVVIVFGDAMDVSALLTRIAASGNTNRLQIISGRNEWATDPSYIEGTSLNGAQYAITHGLALREDADFQQWLNTLSPDDIRANVFLTELFEVTNQCSMVVSTRGVYARVCTNTDSFSPFMANAPYVIQSVYHIADQLHALIMDICGNNYNGLCPAFRSSYNLSQQLYNRIVSNDRGQDLTFSDGKGTPDIVFYVIRGSNYIEFSRFNTEDESLSPIAANSLNPNFNPTTSCSGSCVECQYMYNYQNAHLMLGDWNLVGISSVSFPGPIQLQPYVCGGVRLYDSAEYTTAMFYALDRVNKELAPVSVKGIKMGGLALDHCGNDGLAKLIATDIYAGFLNAWGVYPESILAWLIDNSANSKEGAEILDPLDVAIVSPSATSTALSQFDHFYATLQSDAVVSTALVKLSKQLGFRYIQLVHSDSAYGRDSMLTLTQAAQTEGICVSKSIEFSTSSNATAVVEELVSDETHVVVLYMDTASARSLYSVITENFEASQKLVILQPSVAIVPSGTFSLKFPPISIQLRTFELQEYHDYLNSHPVDNVFYARYYMELFDCNLDGYSMYDSKCAEPLSPITSSPKYVDFTYDLTTINAVYASVDALDRTVKEYCGQNYTQPCAAFLQATDKRVRFNRNLQLVSFIDEGSNVFRFLEREGNVVYNVMQYDPNTRTYERKGTYAGIALNIDSSAINVYNDAQSQCGSPCLQCNDALKYSLTVGDVYLGGVFDVHGPSLDPFTCGTIKTLNGYLPLEAFHYALEKVNGKEGQFQDILRNVRLGGVGLDSCSSRARGGYLVSNINNGQFILSKSSVTVDPDEIDAYIGSYSSTDSKYLARILTDLKIPQISYASQSTDLNDRGKYPYFYRTVPSNDKQVIAMLEYLNQNNIRYVQIVYQGNNNGRSGRDEFEKMAEDYNICVAQAVEYTDLSIVAREQSKIVVATLLEKPAANTVVTFLESAYVNSVLQAIDQTEEAHNTFRFLGSDAWADNLDAITGAERHAIDSVTLKLDTDDVEDFERYINSKNLGNNLNNPWFEEYYQRIHNCYTTRENMNIYQNPCPETLASTINSINYQQDPSVVLVINAVYAAAFALDKTLKDMCGSEYTSVCQAYRNDAERREQFLKNLASVEFTDPSDRLFKFEDRQSPVAYRFYALVPGRLGGVVYDQMGTYNPQGSMLDLEDYTPATNWRSGCDREDACAECPAIRYRGRRYAFAPSPVVLGENATTIVAFFDIHKQGVDPFRCGDLNMPGFQQFLSFFYSIEQPLRAKVEGLRVLVIDTCSNPMRVDQDLFGLLQGHGLCNTEFDNPYRISYENIGSVLVSGDYNTQAAARLLEPLKVSYVSPDALIRSIDYNMHLWRTVAPIGGQTEFLTALFEFLQWNFVDIVYQDSSYGLQVKGSLEHRFGEAGICHGSAIGIGDDQLDAETQNLLRDLNGDQGVRVVVLVGDLDFFKRILTAFGNSGTSNEYLWVLVSQMDVHASFLESVKPASGRLRLLTLNRIFEHDNAFSNYVEALSYEVGDDDRNNGNVPREWFEEFFQIANDCHLSSAQKPVNPDKPECNLITGTDRLISTTNMMYHPFIMNTIAATYAVLHGPAGINARLDNAEMRDRIRAKIREVEWNMRETNTGSPDFTGTHPLIVKWNDMRWWDPGCIVKVWTVTADGVEEPETWAVTVDLEEDDVADDLRSSMNMSSSCVESLADGFCGCKYEVAATSQLTANMITKEDPRNYYLYDDDDGSKTYDWPVWAIVVAVLTTIGLVITFILFLVLLIAYPKKGGTSILGFLVILGIFCIFGINFAFFHHATKAVCGIRRFLMGVVYMIVFAPLLIKAIDNWRFGHVNFSERVYSGISSWCSMLFSALFIILVQCIIPIIWLILEHPGATEAAFKVRDDHWWCDPHDDYDLGLVLSLSFVVFVILLTTIFAALAYDTDTNNYESRWILFGCIVTAGCFLVWMVVTTNAKPPNRDPAVAIANLVNATLLLLIIPFRKAVLMCKARSGDKYDDGREPYYENAYGNEALKLDDYDNHYVDTKPSEY